MLGVRIFILWAITATTCNAQGIFQGEYVLEFPRVEAFGQRILFSDSTFKRYHYSHDGDRVSGGSFTLKGDTLILEYEPLTDPDPSWWEITRKDTLGLGKRSQITEALRVQFTAEAQENWYPVHLYLMDEDNYPVAVLGSDSLGSFPEFFISGDLIKKFRFGGSLQKRIAISTDTLMGFHSEVYVYVSNSQTEYSDYDEVTKYLIMEATEEQIRLESIVAESEGVELLFKRQE